MADGGVSKFGGVRDFDFEYLPMVSTIRNCVETTWLPNGKKCTEILEMFRHGDMFIDGNASKIIQLPRSPLTHTHINICALPY